MDTPETSLAAIRKEIATHAGYWIALAFLILFPFLVGWYTGSSPTGIRGRPVGASVYWQGIMIQVMVYAILAISYNLMFGFIGVISFGHALFFGIGAYITGIGVRHLGLPIGISLLIALITSAILGLLTGMVSLRIKGVYFAMFTLAFATVFYVLAKNRLLVNITGAEDGFRFEVPEWLNPVRHRLEYYYLTLVVFVLVFVLVRRIINSPAGRVFLAIRENEERAQTIGYNTLAFKLLAITTASVLASVAGFLHVILNNKQAQPSLLGVGYTVDPLLMTLVGGMGTLSGPVVGAMTLHLGETILREARIEIGGLTINIGENWEMVLGLAFLIVVIVLPYGIVGTWLRGRASRHKWWGQLQKRLRL